jgi:hypothetical protein
MKTLRIEITTVISSPVSASVVAQSIARSKSFDADNTSTAFHRVAQCPRLTSSKRAYTVLTSQRLANVGS